MSSDEEIRAVFEAEIAQKTRQVANKFGSEPFYDYYADLDIKRVYDGVMSSEDEDMLERLYNDIKDGGDPQ